MSEYQYLSVQGYCPMGCGQTLMLGEGGYVTCSWLHCDNPTAVSEIFSDGETRAGRRAERGAR